jgi:hypothetical protein
VSFGREPSFREDFSAEAEESPVLEAVTRERPVKTQHAGKSLAGAVEISGGAVMVCSSEWCVVVNKPNTQSKIPSRVTHIPRDRTFHHQFIISG